MKLYIDTRPNEPIPQEVAQRFVEFEVPEPQAPYYGLYKTDYIKGQHKMHELIHEAIYEVLS